MNSNKPAPYAYVLLAVIIIAAILLLPVIWKIVKGALKIVLTIVILGFACYGVYFFLMSRSSK